MPVARYERLRRTAASAACWAVAVKKRLRHDRLPVPRRVTSSRIWPCRIFATASMALVGAAVTDDLNNALKQFESVQANNAKLESLWSEIEPMLPGTGNDFLNGEPAARRFHVGVRARSVGCRVG